MRGERRFSQAISEGDGISLLAEVTGASEAQAAEDAGAEGLVARGGAELGETELPVLTYGGAHAAAADAWVLELGDDDPERTLEEALAGGLDCVVAVGDEDELQLALERLDPEILLLRGRDLEQVLGLLPDVPAGKLAVAELAVSARDEVEELERAGVDAVIVPAAALAGLAGEPAPEP